jgi:hypothetical protein
VAVFLPHRGAWVGHNGDHYYYASMALQYAGTGYEESLRVATSYFHYPYSATQLDLGYLSPAVAPLIYPRTTLGLLAAPAVRLLGIEGIWVPGMLCGALSVALLLVLTVRRVGRIGLLAIGVLLGVTRYAPELMFGIYVEAPVILMTTLMLFTFPLGRVRRTWWHAIAAAGLVPIIMLSRQVPLLPIGMVLGGFVWAWIGSRRFRNPWLPFAVAVPLLTVVSYGLASIWAPYNALIFLYAATKTSTFGELLGALPAMWSQSLGVDWTKLVSQDRPMLMVAALGLVGFVLVLRNPLAGVFLGALASGVATELLNGQSNEFRYFAPSLPVVLLLAAFVIAWMVHLLPRLLRQTPCDWAGVACVGAGRPGLVSSGAAGRRMRINRPEEPGYASSRWGPAVAALGAWFMVAGVLAATAAAHRQSPIEGAAHKQVSASTASGWWPFTVEAGTLVCAGDNYQIWFITPDGVRYALSGTAMAASLTTPRILDLAPGRFAYAWPEVNPLLTEGMRLCGSARSFQRDARSSRPQPLS